MCTSNVNALQEFNVNNTRNSSTFQLHEPNLLAACEKQGPLVFCLNPPTNRLEHMCQSATLDPYFASILENPQGVSLDDMPVIWDSLHEASEDMWVNVEGQSGQYVASDGTYYGLQPLPDFVSIAASGASKRLIGVSGGVCFMTNSQSGFMEPQDSIVGAQDLFQRVVVDASGNLGCVLFSNRVFLWQNNTFNILETEPSTYKWIGMSATNANDPRLILVAQRNVDNACTVTSFKSQNDVWVQEWTTQSLPLSSSSFIAWVTTNESRVLVSIGMLISSTYSVFEVTFVNPSFNARWESVPWAQGAITTIDGAPWDAVFRENATHLFVTATNKLQRKAQIVVLDKQQSLNSSALMLAGSIASIQNSIDQTFFSFLDNNTMFVCQKDQVIATSVSVIGIDLNIQASYCFAADTAKFWYIAPKEQGSSISSNVLTLGDFGTSFTTTFELKLVNDAHISDFGLPTIVLQPRTQWFFGYTIIQHARAGLTYLSPHQYYRMTIDNNVESSVNAFPHVTTHLQRANFRVLAKNNIVMLADNSETQIIDSQSQGLILARGTTDSWGEFNDLIRDQQAQIVFEGTQSQIISNNGLYIFYTPDAMFGTGPRVVINVFNSSALALYCMEYAPTTAIGKERLSKSIQQQALFCEQYLQNNSATSNRELIDLSNYFLDKRCACINTTNLMRILYPSLTDDHQSLKPWNTTLARMNQNFPCMSRVCQHAIAQPEITNVYRTTQDKCQPATLTVTTALLTKTPNAVFEIQSGIVQQSCNGAIGSQCGQDEDCPLGSVCVNGKCATNCTGNNECGPVSTCVNGICVFVDAANASTQSSSAYQHMAQTILIVFGVIIVILLIFVVVVVVVRNRARVNSK